MPDASEPIAIVGMACRYPGGAGSPGELWELVAAGTDAIGGFPTDRGWELERLYHPDPDHPGTSYTRSAASSADAAEFDAEFFAIAPREAMAMDPQQRLLLEVSWQALEDAGIDPDSLRGGQAGVFAGISSQDYADHSGEGAVELEGYLSTGNADQRRLRPGRLYPRPRGPGDDDRHRLLLLAGGDAPRLPGAARRRVHAGPGRWGDCARHPRWHLPSSPASAVSPPDGRCKAFAESADGIGFSEGAGMLVLERLSDASRNGHRVLATIRGSAVNQDGASNGLSAPNGPSQERVIRQALANARLSPGDVDAVEAHGTGTTLGDPIEAGALLATYGQERQAPLKLGSVKSNIGHTQAAAGVAGVIKMVLAMQEGVLPKTLHVDAPSSHVDWEAGEIELLTEAEPWPASEHPRRAGVSSFGISGTNAHVILEAAPQPEPSEEEERGAKDAGPQALAGQVLLGLSAKTEPALRASAERLAKHLGENPELNLTDVSFSLATTRSSFERRAVAVGESREQLLGALSALAQGADSPALIEGSARTAQAPVFCFGGQGSQHPRMAAALLEQSPLFADHIDRCEQALSAHVDWSLREVLQEEQGKWMDRLDIVQPALFAVMVSLARLWEALGVRPAALLGHSQGEIAAAHISGGLCLDDAALIIAQRGKAMAKIAGEGAMASVSLGADELRERLSPFGEDLSLAAINGPASQAVSGTPEAIEQLLGDCEKEGIRAQRIAVDYAAHSAQIDALQAELLEAFAPISPQSGEVPLHSTVSGEPIDTKEMDGAYWYRNLRQTVLLEPVLRSLLEQGKTAFLEISPHPVLGFGIQETIDRALTDPEQASVLGTLRRDQGGAERFALSLATAHAAGVEVDWEAFFEGSGAKATKLPTYPFQRKRYWLSAAPAGAGARQIGLGDAGHPLLGAVIEDPGGEGLTLSGRISLQTHPWLADHAVAGAVLLPGTGFAELALRAAQEAGCESVEELTLAAPMLLPAQGALQVQVSVSAPDRQDKREIQIHSRPETGAEDEEPAAWTQNAQGVLCARAIAPAQPPPSWPPEGAELLEVEDFYERLAESGFEYGPAFQGLTRAWAKGEEVFAEVCLAEEQAREAERFAIHPALLDAALHPMALLALRDGSLQGLALPFAWSEVALHAHGAAELRVHLTKQGESLSLAVFDTAANPLAQAGSLALRPLDPAQLQSAGSPQGLLGIAWSEVAAEPAPEAPAAQAWRCPPAKGEGPEQARELSAAALEAVQQWLADPAAEGRLAIITEAAIATAEAESPDPATAALWGLVRSAQSEHPGRFTLIDSDGSEASEAALPAALTSAEPQLALREGVALAPRARALARLGGSLVPPPGPWRLEAVKPGTLESLELVADPSAAAPLGGQRGEDRRARRRAQLPRRPHRPRLQGARRRGDRHRRRRHRHRGRF